MNRLLVIATLVLLAAVPSAHAKGPVSATVCGANGCNEVDHGREIEIFTESGGPTGPPASATGWYRARLAMGAPGEPPQEYITIAVLPDQRLMRGPEPESNWNPLNEEAARAFAAAAADLKPLPPSELGLKAAAPEPAAAPATDDSGGAPWLVLILISAALASIAACAYLLHSRSRSGRWPRWRWPSAPDRPTSP